MDKHTIFSKTKEGEDAVRQRTRLVQRNLRNILIMVDGYSTVADLAKRFGDVAVTEHALAELERSGYIENLEDLVAAEVRAAQPPARAAAAVEAASQDEIPVLTAQAPAVEPDPPAEAGMAAEPAAPPPIHVEEIVAPVLEEYYSMEPPSRPQLPAGAIAGESRYGETVGWIERLWPSLKRARRDKDDREGDDSAGGVIVRRGPRSGVSGLLVVAMVVLAVPAVLAGAAMLFPYERYLPDIEQQASAALKEPVKVGRIAFSFLPEPGITLKDVSIGKERFMTITTVRALPDFLSLLGERKVIRELKLENLSVKSHGFGRIARWGGGSGEPNAVDLRHIAIDNLSVAVADAVIGNISGEVRMKAGGGMDRILLHNQNSSLKLEMLPKGETFQVSVMGSTWKAPFRPNLTFDFLDAQGDLTAARLDLQKIDGRAYEGLLSGKASLDWSRGAALALEIDSKRLNAVRLLPALGPELAADGEISSVIRIEAKADSMLELNDALRAEAAFDMRRGTVHGFDLVEAARSSGRGPTRGGATRFEQFSGTLRLEQGAYRLTSLRLTSGLLKATGVANISKGSQINGVLEVEMRGTAALVKVPLTVSGTTQDPLLQPGRRPIAER